MRNKLLLILGMACITSPLEASSLASYHARLSEQDHYDSAGRRLKSVPAILSQDRANYHRFHKRDSTDQNDSFFNTEHHRALFYKMKIIYRNFGPHPAEAIINEFLDVDIKVIGLNLYVTVSAG